MDWLALLVSLAGLTWAVIGQLQNRRLKKLILREKELIRDRVLDQREALQKYIKVVLNDRKMSGDDTRNQALVRIEDLEAMVANLERFADRLAVLV